MTDNVGHVYSHELKENGNEYSVLGHVWLRIRRAAPPNLTLGLNCPR